MYDCRYWLWLSTKFEPGAIKCDKLLQAFDYNPKAVYEAKRADYESICGSNLRLLNALCDKSLDRVSEILQFCEQNNVGILTQDDPRYPSSLLCIDGQPPVIYYKGIVPDFNNRFSIAIVGTRSVSPYGSSTAYTIAHDIASAGGIIVSGMALGSDTAAHRGALDAKGITVAFLGCGIDVVYPKENAALMKEIIASGAVMTDYPPHSRPEGHHFPVRNRLISGVSRGVLVVEAARRSGALITAEHAYKQGKLIYAIPGRVGELNSEGTNNLLIAGAKTVTKSSDILKDTTLFLDPDRAVNNGKAHGNLSEPCKAPAYKPRAAQTGGYSDRGATKAYGRFNMGAMQGNSSAGAQSAVVRKSLDDDESARAYMSMEIDRKEALDSNERRAGEAAQARADTKARKRPDYSGLSDVEIEVLECLREKGKVTVDSMSQLGIPLPKLLSVLTLLEIKRHVIQHAGGYFELNYEY